MTQNPNLQSGILSSPADAMLGRAISETLKAPASDRTWLFEQFVRKIESFMAAHPVGRPWTCEVYMERTVPEYFAAGLAIHWS